MISIPIISNYTDFLIKGGNDHSLYSYSDFLTGPCQLADPADQFSNSMNEAWCEEFYLASRLFFFRQTSRRCFL